MVLCIDETMVFKFVKKLLEEVLKFFDLPANNGSNYWPGTFSEYTIALSGEVF